MNFPGKTKTNTVIAPIDSVESMLLLSNAIVFKLQNLVTFLRLTYNSAHSIRSELLEINIVYSILIIRTIYSYCLTAQQYWNKRTILHVWKNLPEWFCPRWQSESKNSLHSSPFHSQHDHRTQRCIICIAMRRPGKSRPVYCMGIFVTSNTAHPTQRWDLFVTCQKIKIDLPKIMIFLSQSQKRATNDRKWIYFCPVTSKE